MLNWRWPHGLSMWNWVRDAIIIVGAFSVIVQLVVEPMDRFAALVTALSGGWGQVTFQTPSLGPRILWIQCQGTFVLVLTCPYTTVPRKPLCCVERVGVWLIGIIFHTLWKWSPALKASRLLQSKVNTRSKLDMHSAAANVSILTSSDHQYRWFYCFVGCNILFSPVGHINQV